MFGSSRKFLQTIPTVMQNVTNSFFTVKWSLTNMLFYPFCKRFGLFMAGETMNESMNGIHYVHVQDYSVVKERLTYFTWIRHRPFSVYDK